MPSLRVTRVCMKRPEPRLSRLSTAIWTRRRGGPPLCAGLYLPSLDLRELAEAVETARTAGAAGVSLFEMDGLSDEHLAALRAAFV